MPKEERSQLGYYEGKVVAEFLGDGRLIQLKQPFSYVDPFTMRWDVPSGWKVDGASIPRPLWSLVGSPLVGKYREASIIHDYYCDTHRRPWGAVHRVFYDAMLASHVRPLQAKVMYAAVCWGGPRWSKEVVYRSFGFGSDRKNEFMDDVGSLEPGGQDEVPLDEETTVFCYPFGETDLRWLEKEFEATDICDQGILEFVDAQIKARALSSIEIAKHSKLAGQIEELLTLANPKQRAER
jgi:hypothetical protein